MKIFSLDTSFSFFNFSVIEDGKVILIHYIDSDKKTLENLPKVLADLNVNLEEFDAFAVSRGIGYLTALRIGITFMKSAAYLLKKPVVSYENLYLMCRYTHIPPPKAAYLQVSNYVFYRLMDEDGNISDVKIYEGEDLNVKGITIPQVTEKRITEDTVELPFFPFSAYGGLYAYEFLKEKKEGENVFLIEPLYMRPPV